MPFIRVHDIDMHYAAHGPQDGPPLILLHSFLTTAEIFKPFIKPLTERFRLYLPDWRGHGRTNNPRPEISHAQLGRDMAAFAVALDLEQAHFCGYSSGGMQLPFVALEHPELVRSLTLVAASYTFDDNIKAEVRKVRGAATPKWIEEINSLHHHSTANTLLDQWLEAVHRPGELPFTPADLAKITCPTLILHGDRDNYFPLDIPLTIYRSIPNADLCIVPKTGHMLPVQSPELFLTSLVEFLRRNS